MPWREVTLGGTRWNVSVIAERAERANGWHLVLSFRAPATRRPSVWAAYPLESSSQAALFAQAERISDDKLADLLARQIG